MNWRDIPSAPGYQASEAGEVRSVFTNRPLKGGRDKDGYIKFVLCLPSGRVYRRRARLVAEAFHGPAPEGYVLRHLNGIRTDDRPDNIAWSTQMENLRDKVAHGTQQIGERASVVKLTEAQARRIKFGGESYRVLTAELGISQATVSAIRTGRNWKHLA